MVIDMDDEQLRTLADVQGFLDGTVAMEFAVVEAERYVFIARGGADQLCQDLHGGRCTVTGTYRHPARHAVGTATDTPAYRLTQGILPHFACQLGIQGVSL